ncbi:MAG: ABC transporter ATP-binding protein [Desulfobulbaceae bacterium]|nr:ABC transporter ATP-binding protein [Desulfobulbaceae bacterium]
MIEAINLCKTYRAGGQTLAAADCVNFKVAKGEMVAVVGHSGSGKTTLLSLLGGLTRPDSGQVSIAGVDIWTLSDARLSELRNLKLGFIYQFSSLIPTLSVLDNVCLPSVFGPQTDNPNVLAKELLAQVGLADKADFYPAQLSGGQQRRVAIARAFIGSPAVILADEPTGDLDEDTEREIINLFRRVNAEQATTFVIVTHNREIAAQVDRQLVMKNGVLI